ncbi:MAG: B12-binding domain-containing radical SAM protein [Myxococcota bacterium]
MRTRERVLLINPSMQTYYEQMKVKSAITQSPPLNIAVVAGALLRAGHEVRALDLDGEPWREKELPQLLRQFDPGLVGITFRTPVFREAKRLAAQVRLGAPHARLIAGGVHASVRPEEVVQGPFDIAVINEGDLTILELAAGKPLEEIPSICFLKDGLPFRTPERTTLVELDGLAYPAWQLFDIKPYRRQSLVARHPPVVDLESSRGCPAKCIYCTQTIFGEGFRGKSPRRFVQEVEAALQFGFKSFNLVDDSFTTDIRRAIAVCEELLAKRIQVPWTLTNGIRVSHTNEDFFKIAAKAGLSVVAFGLETGSQKLLNTVGKGATLNQARRAVSQARSNGITTVGYFMVGLPGEDQETLQATVEFARELDLDFAKFSITVPLPGTALFDRWEPYINQENYHNFNIHKASRGTFENPGLSWEEIETFLKRAYRAFYFRRDYLYKRFTRDLKEGNLLFNARAALEIQW